MTRPIEIDDFAKSVEDILEHVCTNVEAAMPQVVREGAKAGAKAWRRNAKRQIPDGQVYMKHGKEHTTGAYVRSIRTHMTSKDAKHPEAEVGSPKMPGLPHLLEFGHARIGGGRVRAIVHVAPAAEEAFDAAEKAAEKAMEGVLRGK